MHLLLTAFALMVGATTHTASPLEAGVRAAIVASVRARMGEAASVDVSELDIRGVTSAARLRAVPDAGSKVGGPMRFLLVDAAQKGDTRRLGSADALINVSIVHVRARHSVARGQVLTQADLSVSQGDVGRVPLQPLPALVEAIGAAARRDLETGALLTRQAIELVPLVRSGDAVTTIVRLGAVEARGRAVAGGTASLGQAVRVVVNRRTLRARVVGAGEVEIQR